MSTNDNSSIALARDGSDNTRLAPTVLELGNLGTLGSTGSNDRLNLLEQPIGGLLTIGGCVVSVIEAGEGCQSGAHVRLAQLGQQGLDSRSLSDGAGEAGEKLKTVAGFIEISDVDEVLVLLL